MKPMAIRATSNNNNMNTSCSNSTLNSSGNSANSTPSNKPVLVSSTPSKNANRESPPVPQLQQQPQPPPAGNFASVAANCVISKPVTCNYGAARFTMWQPDGVFSAMAESVQTSVIPSMITQTLTQSAAPTVTTATITHTNVTPSLNSSHTGHVSTFIL